METHEKEKSSTFLKESGIFLTDDFKQLLFQLFIAKNNQHLSVIFSRILSKLDILEKLNQ